MFCVVLQLLSFYVQIDKALGWMHVTHREVTVTTFVRRPRAQATLNACATVASPNLRPQTCCRDTHSLSSSHTARMLFFRYLALPHFTVAIAASSSPRCGCRALAQQAASCLVHMVLRLMRQDADALCWILEQYTC